MHMKQFPTLIEFLANSVSLKIESHRFQIKCHNCPWGGGRAPPPLGLGLSTVWVLGSVGARPLRHQVRPQEPRCWLARRRKTRMAPFSFQFLNL